MRVEKVITLVLDGEAKHRDEEAALLNSLKVGTWARDQDDDRWEKEDERLWALGSSYSGDAHYLLHSFAPITITLGIEVESGFDFARFLSAEERKSLVLETPTTDSDLSYVRESLGLEG